MNKKITKLIAVYDDGSIGEVKPTPTADAQIIEVGERMKWLNALVNRDSPKASINQLHVGNDVALATDGFRIHLTYTPDYLEQFSDRGLKVRMIGDSAAEVQPVDSAIANILSVCRKAEHQIWAGKTQFVLLNPRYLMDALRGMEYAHVVRIDILGSRDEVLISAPASAALIKAMTGKRWSDFAKFDKTDQ